MSATASHTAAAAAAASEAIGSAPEFRALLERVRQDIGEVAKRQAIPAVQPMELRTFDELHRWAEFAARSGMVPKDYAGKPEAIMLAVQMGAELGLRPMQSIQNIAVIGNRPAVWGDAMLALCQGHPLFGGVDERFEGEGDARKAICTTVRKGEKPKTVEFSVADAKKAGLWGKSGIWSQYPDRMLKMRARAFGLRDAFADALRGLMSAEEAGDYQEMPASAQSAPPAPAYVSAAPEPPAAPEGQKRIPFSTWLATYKEKLAGAVDRAALMALAAGDETAIQVRAKGSDKQKVAMEEVENATLEELIKKEPIPVRDQIPGFDTAEDE